MTSAPFDACWSRIARADKHRKEAVDIWNDYYQQHPCQYSLDHEGDGVHILRVWRDKPMPADFATVTGEWFNSLRTTLDYIVFATAAHVAGTMPPPGAGQLQYPIYDTEAVWNSNLYRLKSLAEHHPTMLREMQPFASDNDANYLGWINRLARIDRHRHPSAVGSYLAELNPIIELPRGHTADLQWGDRHVTVGKSDVARVTIRPWHEGLRVRMNPRSIVDPEIRDWAASPFWARVPYGERISMIHIFVMAEIAIYEYDSTGATRRPEALTDSYKAECDARAGHRKAVTVTAAADQTRWSLAPPGKPSGRARFQSDTNH